MGLARFLSPTPVLPIRVGGVSSPVWALGRHAHVPAFPTPFTLQSLPPTCIPSLLALFLFSPPFSFPRGRCIYGFLAWHSLHLLLAHPTSFSGTQVGAFSSGKPLWPSRSGSGALSAVPTQPLPSPPHLLLHRIPNAWFACLPHGHTVNCSSDSGATPYPKCLVRLFSPWPSVNCSSDWRAPELFWSG